MGMRERQILRRVELPLALPVILAGVRIGGGPGRRDGDPGAIVGGGGLGRYIVDGFALRGEERRPLVAGRSSSRCLALVTERAFTLVERRLVVARAPAAPTVPVEIVSIPPAPGVRSRSGRS